MQISFIGRPTSNNREEYLTHLLFAYTILKPPDSEEGLKRIQDELRNNYDGNRVEKRNVP